MEDIDEALRVLERKALMNVRALVDKVEAEDRNRSRVAVTLAVRSIPALLVFLVILAGVVAFLTWRERQPLPPPRDTAEYVEQILSRIEHHGNGRSRHEIDGLNGRVGVSFDVKANGYIENLEVIDRSFDRTVENQATRLTKGLEPYRPLPASGAHPVHVRAVFHFITDSSGRGSVNIERNQRP